MSGERRDKNRNWGTPMFQGVREGVARERDVRKDPGEHLVSKFLEREWQGWKIGLEAPRKQKRGNCSIGIVPWRCQGPFDEWLFQGLHS